MTAVIDAVGCTIVAENYLPYARVLDEGWRRHHPGLPFRVLVIDEDRDARRFAGLDALRPADLGIPATALAEMRGIYGIAELTTAMKPHLLRFLLGEGAEAAVFLDADTDIHAGLELVALEASRHGVALSAHLLEPPPLDGFSPTESEIAWSGTFNSGFIAVGAAGTPFLDWWESRLRRDCLFCEPMGTHADQRWLDLVPSYFDHSVIRDPGVNVAQWNVHERRIRWEDEVFTVNDGLLRTFHFSGFDPERPERPGPDDWPAPLRFAASEERALLRLCRQYADKLLTAGIRESRGIPYPHARSASGRMLRTWERRLYREVLLAAEARGVTGVPDPFDPAAAPAFERMMERPQEMGLSAAALARIGDARLAGELDPGAGRGRLRRAVAFSRQAARRLPVRRHGWMPYPLPGDRTRFEYADGASLAIERKERRA